MWRLMLDLCGADGASSPRVRTKPSCGDDTTTHDTLLAPGSALLGLLCIRRCQHIAELLKPPTVAHDEEKGQLGQLEDQLLRAQEQKWQAECAAFQMRWSEVLSTTMAETRAGDQGGGETDLEEEREKFEEEWASLQKDGSALVKTKLFVSAPLFFYFQHARHMSRIWVPTVGGMA